MELHGKAYPDPTPDTGQSFFLNSPLTVEEGAGGGACHLSADANAALFLRATLLLTNTPSVAWRQLPLKREQRFWFSNVTLTPAHLPDPKQRFIP